MRIFIYICRQKVESVNLIKSQSFQAAQVYIRLGIVSGILWIIGILSGILKSEFLDIFFVIICSLQGLFITMSNLTTRQVCARLRKKSEYTITTS